MPFQIRVLQPVDGRIPTKGLDTPMRLDGDLFPKGRIINQFEDAIRQVRRSPVRHQNPILPIHKVRAKPGLCGNDNAASRHGLGNHQPKAFVDGRANQDGQSPVCLKHRSLLCNFWDHLDLRENISGKFLRGIKIVSNAYQPESPIRLFAEDTGQIRLYGRNAFALNPRTAKANHFGAVELKRHIEKKRGQWIFDGEHAISRLKPPFKGESAVRFAHRDQRIHTGEGPRYGFLIDSMRTAGRAAVQSRAAHIASFHFGSEQFNAVAMVNERERSLFIPNSSGQKRSLGSIDFEDIRPKLPDELKAVDKETDGGTPIAGESEAREKIELFRSDEFNVVASLAKPLGKPADDVSGAL